MKPCQYCLAEGEWPVCKACNTRLARFMALVGHLTHYNLPPMNIPRFNPDVKPVAEAPLPRRRERR